jgi:hypothetical protein
VKSWATIAVVMWVACACREEPTIVIKFEPADLAQTAAKDGGAAASAAKDGGAAASAAKDGGAAATHAAPGHECKVAADCIVEPAECCDCANGGKQHAIAKKRAAASKAERAKKCKGVMCTMMLSTDPTCGQTAACIDGRCAMAPRKD